MTQLTDSQVRAGALPGETWEEARDRLYMESLNPDRPSGSYWISQRPAYLLPQHPGERPDQLEALRAFQRLSRVEQFEEWLSSEGKARPIGRPLDCPSLQSLVAEGFVWHACATRLPHEDGRGRLCYLVSVEYDDWLTLCRYTPMGWECVSDASLISGVTHWRIADNDEQCSREATADEINTLRALRYA